MNSVRAIMLPLALIILPSSLAMAGLPLPGNVYELEDIDEAQDEAKKWGQVIAFVWTDLNCGCSLAESATYDTFREFRDDITLVYACSETEWNQLPGVVKRAINSSESGKYIPITIIVDEDISRVIAIIPYIRNPQERISVLEQAVKTINEDE